MKQIDFQNRMDSACELYEKLVQVNMKYEGT